MEELHGGTERRGLLLVVGLVGALACGLWFWFGGAAPEPTAPGSPGTLDPGHGEPSSVAVAEPAVSEAAERIPVNAVVPIPASDRVLGTVTGRCIAAETGEPLARCTVSFRGRARSSSANVDWENPEPVLTGEDGRFEFAFEALPTHSYTLGIELEGRAPRTGRWSLFEPGQIENLGDIPLLAGFRVTGQVVDDRGAPVERVNVRLEDLPLPVREGMSSSSTRGGRSDTEGRFQIDAVPAGVWPLLASGQRGLKLDSPDTVTVREGAEPVRVVLRRMPSISGIVVDEAGMPAAGVRIRTMEETSGRVASASTAEDGTFTLHAVRDDQQLARLTLEGSRHESVGDAGVHEWGRTDVRLVVQRTLSVELMVVEEGSGEPVEEYAIICHPERGGSTSYSRPRSGGRHPGGMSVVHGVWRGKNYVSVVPSDPTLMKSDVVELEASEVGVAPLVIEVQRMGNNEVRVVDESGRPISGTRVEVILEGDRDFESDSNVNRPGEPTMSSTSGRVRFPELLSEGVTDERGVATVLGPADRELILRATGRSHLTVLERDVRLPLDGSVVEIVASEGGGISGSVALSGLGPEQVTVILQRSRDPRRTWTREVPLREDGGFTERHLEPGEYTVFLDVRLPHQRNGRTGVRLAQEFARVTVRSGRTGSLELDATAVRPGSLRGRVLLGGVAPGSARVEVVGVDGIRGRYGELVPDAGGNFQVPQLLPGTYRVDLITGDFKASEGDVIRSESRFALAAGEELARDFHFIRRVLRIRLLQHDGAPLSRENVAARAEGLYRRLTTDEEGWIVFDPLPADLEITLASSGPVPWDAGPVRLSPGKLEDSVEVTIRNR